MKPALKTPGVAIGGGGASFVLGLLVSDLLGPQIDWKLASAKALALALLVAWALFTARHPEVVTGIDALDKDNREPEA